jgi:hypothetical protein
VTEFEQMLGRLDRAGHVRRGDEREVTVEGVPLVRDDEREALLLQQEEVFDRLVGKHEDRAVDLSFEELVDERDLSSLMVKGGAQNGLHVELVQRLRETGDQLGEVVAEHLRDRHADQPGPAGRRRRRPERPVRREVELPDDLEHRLARLGRDVRTVVEDA